MMLSWLLLISIGASAFAEQPYVMPFGHDTSSTSYTLHDHECTVGIQTLACGLSDEFSLGVSPWLMADYNMVATLARWRFETSPTEQKALQFGYFKTFEAHRGSSLGYQMELAWFYYIQSYFLTPNAILHWNAQAMYFRDDKRPFSLRRPWVDRRPLQVNATALAELHVYQGWYLNAESGVLGLLQTDPQILIAVTLEYRLSNWLFHGGLSQLGTLAAYRAPLLRSDAQQDLRWQPDGFDSPMDPSLAKYDYSIHPEFAIQYYF